jgi:hypothetical protein
MYLLAENLNETEFKNYFEMPLRGEMSD